MLNAMNKLYIFVNFILLINCTFLSSLEINSKNLQIVGNYDDTNYCAILPIGWSKSGCFAYVIHDTNPLGSSSIYIYKIIVQNMITDEILFQKQIVYNFEDDYDLYADILEKIQNLPHDPERPLDDSRLFWEKIAWPEYKLEIIKVLKEFKIIPKDHSFKNINILTNSGYQIKEIKIQDKIGLTKKYEIIISKNGKGEKCVYSYYNDTQKDDYGNSIWMREFDIISFIKSPFEDRIAVLVFKTTDGYEEPWEFPFFVGIHLEKGFK